MPSASRPLLFFPCVCYTRDVADPSELIVARDAQSPFVGARGPSVCCVQGSTQIAFRMFLVEPDVSPHLNLDRTHCVGVQRSESYFIRTRDYCI